MQSFRELVVWQKSYRLSLEIYSITKKLPSSERYGLVSQIQRSAVSIPCNIAEGQQRNNRAEFRQFIGIARGSAAELEVELSIVHEIYNLNVSAQLQQLFEIQKMLQSLMKKLQPIH